MAFAVFFAFLLLTVKFDSVKLPALILGSAPFCLAGFVLGPYLSGLAFGATVVTAILVVIALNVNDGPNGFSLDRTRCRKSWATDETQQNSTPSFAESARIVNQLRFWAPDWDTQL